MVEDLVLALAKPYVLGNQKTLGAGPYFLCRFNLVAFNGATGPILSRHVQLSLALRVKNWVILRGSGHQGLAGNWGTDGLKVP
jgi:hypothetical protein